MKYAPHPWDKYGNPNIGPEDEDDTEELEDQAAELRDFIADKERDIEDLEDELRDAEAQLYQIETLLRAGKSASPGQARHSDEY